MPKSRSLEVEQLLRHAEWLERLARRLVGDSAEDLTQEVWLATHQAGPAADRPPGPWLTAVMRNLGLAWRRNEGRRVRRDQAYQDLLPREVSPADAAYERLELQRLVAEQVVALEPPLREVILLRYFEGQSSTRIAQLTGAAEGTVRWRLKVALDRLRDALDVAHGGQRRRWVALLGGIPTRASATPPAVGAAGTGIERTGPSATALGQKAGILTMSTTAKKATLGVVAAALLALLLISLGVVRWTRHPGEAPGGRGAESSGEPGRIAAADSGSKGREGTSGGAALSGPPAFTVAALADLESCERARARARREAAALDRAARDSVPSVAFQSGRANPRLEAEVAPQIASLWSGDRAAPGLSHELVCRDWACRLTVMAPGADSDDVGPWIRAITPVMQVSQLRRLRLSAPSPRGIAFEMGGWTPADQQQGSRWLEKFVFFIGSPPVPAADGPSPPTAASQPPTGSLAECRRQIELLQQRIRTRQAQLAGFSPPVTRFATGDANPELTAKVQALVEDAMAAPERPRVECRDAVCRLTFTHAPASEVLTRLQEPHDLGGPVQMERGATTEAFLTVAQEGWSVLSRLLEPSRQPNFFSDCPEPDQPGKVLVRFHVPSTGRRNDQGHYGRISLTVLSGELASTPAGVCLAERLAALVSDQDLPDPIGDFVRLESWSWEPGETPAMHDR